ncbi:MAG: hypothetical protein CMJ78_02710 [Planctomycetaceae bacterium]|nr:hypothetical protein [Planctomycetaceae bacterium]
MSANFQSLLPLLANPGVRFILIGGCASLVHGSARFQTLVNALKDVSPGLRGAPPGLPFFWDEATIRLGLNFTLTTDLRDLDLLGEVPGNGTYDALVPDSIEIQVFGTKCLCVSLPRLIQLKRAAGCPKDLEAIAELESLLDEKTD